MQNPKQNSPSKKAANPGINIVKMRLDKTPDESVSTLEFILNTLCRAIKFKPVDAAVLLTNNN